MNEEKGKNQEVETSNIETAEDLEACYPQLVSEVKDTVIREIESWSVKKIRKEFPDLIRRIGAEIGLPQGLDARIKGFLLEEFVAGDQGRPGRGDPFSAGTLRVFAELKNVGDLQLPYILPYTDPFTRPTLESYILRSQGGGDQTRADIAKKALAKCK